jgi:hypothetical protein
VLVAEKMCIRIVAVFRRVVEAVLYDLSTTPEYAGRWSPAINRRKKSRPTRRSSGRDLRGETSHLNRDSWRVAERLVVSWRAAELRVRPA